MQISNCIAHFCWYSYANLSSICFDVNCRHVKLFTVCYNLNFGIVCHLCYSNFCDLVLLVAMQMIWFENWFCMYSFWQYEMPLALESIVKIDVNFYRL